jgi:hypothetical protein
MKQENKMYTAQQQYERLKIEILRGLNSYLVGFENETKVMSALEAIDRYNNESNEFIKESMLAAYQSANKFIDDWKQNHIIKADKVIKQKEDEIKLQIANRKKAKAKAPELEKAYNNLTKIMNEMSELDKDVFISPYNSIYGNKKASSSEIISDFEAMINKTIEGAK